ncbi:MAG: serine hydrolase [Aureispira sp.]|nr:serine hydrolase [Aureispira sp.]
MRRISILISLLLSYLLGIAQDSRIQDIDRLLKSIDSSNLLMGSLSIYQKGKEVYNFSIGWSDLRKDLKNSKHTKYRIGSITKSFTAVIIMQLIEEKKLSLDTKISAYLPNIPNANTITIEHLLRHKSGLFNITESPTFLTWMESFHTRNEMINLIISSGTVFSPGKKKKYSNTNYILLSIIAEKIEGAKYAQILEERIFSKCQLANTYYGGEINTKHNEALSYFYKDSDWVSSSMTDMSIPIGAGAIVSNPEDLNTFYFQLFNGNLITEESLNLMTSNNNLFEFALYPVLSINSKACFGHEGRIDGFHSFSAYFPDGKISISFCANAELIYLNELLLQILNIYFDIPPTSQERIGCYKNDNISLELTPINSSLLAKIDNSNFYFLESSGKKKYSSLQNDISIKFLNKDRLVIKTAQKKVLLKKELNN